VTPPVPGAALRRSAVALCALSTALVVTVAALFAADLVDEGWAVAGFLIGVPLLAAVIALVCALRASTARAALVVSLLAVASLVWAVITVVGLGLYLLLPALVLCAAAVLLVVCAREGARVHST